MTRDTIGFGIDLGTTNSSIARMKGTQIEVIRNNEGDEYTPSAVYIDSKSQLHVGKRAKERLEDDPDNAFSEFKLQMGSGEEKTFVRSSRRMKPEELSAEVLKRLKADVRQRLGEDITAAVITVPAAFELPQCEATKRAAQLAGLTLSPLLQEPVSAALAYGFQTERERAFWLVYDFGGGTFDAAVIQVRDGTIQVVNHGGDNHLGGKLIDWEIVEQLLIPAITKAHRLSDFNRRNSKWRRAIARLKDEAEKAKIRVSRDESAEIVVDFLCNDDRGEPVRVEHELRRVDVERILEPFVLRSVNICRKVLSEKRLAGKHIEKVILVGGPTLAPYLRQRLVDEREGLGIPVEFSVDPFTVVAGGAAIFAGTQRIAAPVKRPVKSDEFAIQLEYKPVGADPEPDVGGKVLSAADTSLEGFTIEFVNRESRPEWRSGKVSLDAKGTFMTTLWAEKNRVNTYNIELADRAGSLCRTAPDHLTYTVGLTITDPPLTHSVGVAKANNEVEVFFEKGASLPARRRLVLRSAYDVRAHSSKDIVIPVVEGQVIRRADRNKEVGTLVIPGAKLKRDVLAGAEIEITIEIDQSRLVRTKAYIPLLDEEYEEVLHLLTVKADPIKLKNEIDAERRRLSEVSQKAVQIHSTTATQVLDRIRGERIEHDLESALDAANTDSDSIDKCQSRLLDLRKAVDEAEDALEWPAVRAEAERELRLLQEVLSEFDLEPSEVGADLLIRETREAIKADDVDLLRRKLAEVSGLKYSLLWEQPAVLVAWLKQMEEKVGSMRDTTTAQQWIAQGHRAIANNDLPSLQTALQQLIALLPAEQQQELHKGFGSTVI